jgi:predicted GNAT family acetyltransferase
MSAPPTVTNNTAAERFEAQTSAGMASLRYVLDGTTLDLIHTEVPSEAEGQGVGVGAALAHAALEHARREGLSVIPSCSFVRSYVTRHHEFADLVAAP